VHALVLSSPGDEVPLDWAPRLDDIADRAPLDIYLEAA
jgi:hypothetical protein